MKKNYTFLVMLCFLFFGINSALAQNTPESPNKTIATNWLNNYYQKYNLTSSDIEDLVVTNDYYSKVSDLHHLYLNQSYQGIKIYNAVSSVAIRNNAVINFANAFVADIANKVNTVTPVKTPLQAVQAVSQTYGLGALNNVQLINNSNNSYTFSKGDISKTEIPVELNYTLNNEGDLILSWNLSIQTLDSKNWYSVRVNAVTGEIENMNNWILSCDFGDGNHSNHKNHSENHSAFNLFKSSSMLVDGSQYNVFALPAESPNHGPLQLVSQPASLDASPFGWHDTNGSTGAEYTITRGNNVWAQEDIDGNDDDLGYVPDGGAALNFSGYDTNIDQNPLGYQDLAITNLFYMNNMMHDIWYQYGFDEASGNFQQNNYGNGGAANDFVYADAQDGSGLNNATFGTPADGGNPVMTMFLWSASGPPGEPLTINNGALAGGYTATIATFGDSLTSTPITSDLALIVDNNISGMASTDVNDGCNAVTNGAALAGKIVVIRRGVCEFGFKVKKAQDNNALAVIVVNNVPDAPIQMGGGATGATVNIPSVMVNQADGEAIITALLNGDTINATLLDAGPYQIDGDLDNVIVGHEYGHGISSRLAGGPFNPGCLGNAEQMGEGWSDWFGLMITMKASDLPETGRGIGTFAIGQGVSGGGIRPYQYSTDTAVNPFTYGDTNNTGLTSQPHGIGSVWATVLWDLTWAYVDKYGFDSDLYNGTGGNNKVMKLVLDGLKLQPCGAGFVQGRDGILAADAADGGEDQCMIWEVFAARGLGVNASQGSSNSRTDQVEDFTTPPDTDPTLANCTSLSVQDFNNGKAFKIYPNPANNEINVSVSKFYGNVSIVVSDINGRQVISKKDVLDNVMTINTSMLQSGLYILSIKGDNISINEKVIID